jgi:hypothetical protein
MATPTEELGLGCKWLPHIKSSNSQKHHRIEQLARALEIMWFMPYSKKSPDLLRATEVLCGSLKPHFLNLNSVLHFYDVLSECEQPLAHEST